jgi:sialidase-1
MQDGTLVVAAQYQDPPAKNRLPHFTIIYSKDHGKTWQVGTGAFDDTTEAQAIEISPGVLMLNCRYNRQSVRAVMTTHPLRRQPGTHDVSAYPTRRSPNSLTTTRKQLAHTKTTACCQLIPQRPTRHFFRNQTAV